MPSASEKLRQKITDRFGSIGDQGPMKFLTERGFTLGRDWCWRKPGIKSNDDLTQEEWEAVLFLIHEWDFGGLEAARDA